VSEGVPVKGSLVNTCTLLYWPEKFLNQKFHYENVIDQMLYDNCRNSRALIG